MERRLPNGSTARYATMVWVSSFLNSNSDSHFSFTNALGVISADAGERDRHGLRASTRGPAGSSGFTTIPSSILARQRVLSERVGTTLVNGNWFLRRLQPMAKRCSPHAWA